MYYKITNKDCEVYNKLHAMRSKEINMEEANKQAIKDKTGLDFKGSLGHHGQQNFSRVTEYTGFKFTEPEKVDLKVWKLDKEHEGVYVPNRRYKAGREMAEFINNGLQGSMFNYPLKILGLEENPRRFTFPFVEIQGDIIIMYLDEQFEPKDENVIEITKKEFNELYK